MIIEKELLQIVYLGNHFINGNRKVGEEARWSTDLRDEIFGEYARKSGEDLDELLEQAFETTIDWIESYEKSAVFDTLGKMFADKNFPIESDRDENADMHFLAEEIYGLILERHGIKALNLRLSDFLY